MKDISGLLEQQVADTDFHCERLFTIAQVQMGPNKVSTLYVLKSMEIHSRHSKIYCPLYGRCLLRGSTVINHALIAYYAILLY